MRTSWPLGRHVAPFYSGIYKAVNAMRIDAGEHITQIRKGIDTAQFSGLDQRQDRSGAPATAH